MISKEQIIKLSSVSEQRAEHLVGNLNDSMAKYGIITKDRIRHFLAQILHESGGFIFKVENLNYSDKALVTVFKKYFPTIESTEGYARKPEKIANKVYSNRMGNGDEASGDGWKFRGRGALQITGKNNYETLSKNSGIDFVGNPSLLESDKYYFEGAAWFWAKNGLNELADDDNLLAITKRINGGTNGYDDRVKHYNHCKEIIV